MAVIQTMHGLRQKLARIQIDTTPIEDDPPKEEKDGVPMQDALKNECDGCGFCEEV